MKAPSAEKVALGLLKADFNEADHPRDEKGRFTLSDTEKTLLVSLVRTGGGSISEVANATGHSRTKVIDLAKKMTGRKFTLGSYRHEVSYLPPMSGSLSGESPGIKPARTGSAAPVPAEIVVRSVKLKPKSDFNEADHPRDESGKFTAGGGASTPTVEGDSVSSLSELHSRISEPDGGFTYSPTTKMAPTTGYAVSPYPQRSVAVPVEKLSLRDLLDYQLDNADLLSQPDHCFGGWHDPGTGMVFLDVSVVKADEKEAHDLAMKHDQIAYFDLAKMTSVVVNRDATSGGALKKGGERG